MPLAGVSSLQSHDRYTWVPDARLTALSPPPPHLLWKHWKQEEPRESGNEEKTLKNKESLGELIEGHSPTPRKRPPSFSPKNNIL